LQGILSPTAGTNNSLWSLAYEWWYYLQFPMLVLVFSKSTRPSLRLLYLACLVGSTVFVGREIVALFPTWVLGAAIAALRPTKLSKAAAIPLLTFSISCLVLVKMFDMSKYWAAWGAAIAFSVILFCAVRQRGSCTNVAYRRVAGFFSDISYTLYLIHLPLAIFICALVDRPWHYYPLSIMNVSMFLLMNAAVVVAASVFYKLFEGNTDRIRRALANKGEDTGVLELSLERSEARARFG
jgi:peptidoglycan/LPS O-acetylase OafA/YrhL